MSNAWYDRETGELPEFTFLKHRKLREGALVFDLGAHQAVIALIMANMVHESGKVVAVEAGTHNFEIALENKSLNGAANLSLIHAAVADRSGLTLSFTGGINGSVSSSGEKVLSITIDDLYKKYGKPDVVWLDVEGYECKALEGASETLKSGPDWHVEVHSGCGLESFGGSADELWKTFRSHGYTVYGRTGQKYEDHFEVISSIPKGHCYLIATKGIPN